VLLAEQQVGPGLCGRALKSAPDSCWHRLLQLHRLPSRGGHPRLHVAVLYHQLASLVDTGQRTCQLRPQRRQGKRSARSRRWPLRLAVFLRARRRVRCRRRCAKQRKIASSIQSPERRRARPRRHRCRQREQCPQRREGLHQQGRRCQIDLERQERQQLLLLPLRPEYQHRRRQAATMRRVEPPKWKFDAFFRCAGRSL